VLKAAGGARSGSAGWQQREAVVSSASEKVFACVMVLHFDAEAPPVSEDIGTRNGVDAGPFHAVLILPTLSRTKTYSARSCSASHVQWIPKMPANKTCSAATCPSY